MRRSLAAVSVLCLAAAAACDTATGPHDPRPTPAEPPVATVPLEERQLPDGSGALSVPRGWQLTAQNAMVDATGPEGAVSLGLNAQIYDAGTPMAPVTSAFGSPARNFQDVMGRFLNIPVSSVRILEQAPYGGWTAGPAAILHFAMPSNTGPVEGVALVMTQRTGVNSFLYYASLASAPRARFASNLPTLVRVWQSWRTSNGVFPARLDEAMRALSGISDIVRGVHDRRQQSLDRTNGAWDEAIRGVQTYEDRDTGERRQLPNGADGSRSAVERLNRAAGYERYRLVPPGTR